MEDVEELKKERKELDKKIKALKKEKSKTLGWSDYIGYTFIAVIIVGLLFIGYMSIFGLSSQNTITNQVTAKAAVLPANIQSSAPMKFNSFEEEVAYMEKNAKNPNNINIRQAIKNMDENLDGMCDKCGMAILDCIESGMENM